jgi:hypothetical protein
LLENIDPFMKSYFQSYRYRILCMHTYQEFEKDLEQIFEFWVDPEYEDIDDIVMAVLHAKERRLQSRASVIIIKLFICLFSFRSVLYQNLR